MLDSIYIGMSGLMSFTKGLDNISNNVANLNTPGFKGSNLEFADLYYRYQYSGSADQQQTPYAAGSGVRTGGTSLNFNQGEFRQTGSDLDAAISGNGFFVLRKDGETTYTRDGQFKIDDAGFLVAQSDGARVAGNAGGGLSDISISGKRSNSAKATSSVVFSDMLSTSDTTFSVSSISVFDSLGKEHALTLQLTNDSATTPGRWTFSLLEGSTTVTSGEVRYSGSGDPLAGFDTYSFTYTPGGGANPQPLILDFTGTRYLSASASSMKVASQDGFTAGFLTKTALDTDGNLVLTYSNGQVLKGQQLALAWFDNLSALQAQGGNRFTVFGETGRLLSNPGKDGLGSLQTGGIELSNVDLAQEFSELIVVQRGYQASSQVITAANEMLQQLGEIRGRR